ncbi:substrate-binding periplasmic protein [Undibacterium sp. Ji67W]|uniref:substrate-binding periplasmic protein n=1 Tax=Undibacterium sp. Ji67W TaxID=3413042 RepID=UPI003BF2505A
MFLKKLLSTICICVCAFFATPANAERLVIYAEDAKPYAYFQDDKVSSPITEFVRTLVERAGYDPEIRLLSWAGIMHTAEAQQAVIFYPLARTNERENKYHWLGTLLHYEKYNFYKLKNRRDIQLKKLEDAKKFRIGVIESDLREDYLIENGFAFNPHSGLIQINNNTDGMRLLLVNRIDLLPLSVTSFTSECAAHCSDYEMAFTLNIRINLELAANKATPPEIIQRIRRAYESLENDGTRARMLDKE